MDLYDLRLLYVYRHTTLLIHEDIAAYCGMTKTDMLALRRQLLENECLAKIKTYKTFANNPARRARLYDKGSTFATMCETTERGLHFLKQAEWYDPATPVVKPPEPKFVTRAQLRELAQLEETSAFHRRYNPHRPELHDLAAPYRDAQGAF